MVNSKNLPTSHPVKEAATIVGVSEATLRAMIRTGKLHGYKVGTCSTKAQWRVTDAELQRFMGGEVTAND